MKIIRPMTPLRRRMLEDMQIRNLSPNTIDGYLPDDFLRVQQVCRYIAGNLGELREHITVMGGLVPFLLIGDSPPAGVSPHIGTLDVDLGLILAHDDKQRLE